MVLEKYCRNQVQKKMDRTYTDMLSCLNEINNYFRDGHPTDVKILNKALNVSRILELIQMGYRAASMQDRFRKRWSTCGRFRPHVSISLFQLGGGSLENVFNTATRYDDQLVAHAKEVGERVSCDGELYITETEEGHEPEVIMISPTGKVSFQKRAERDRAVRRVAVDDLVTTNKSILPAGRILDGIYCTLNRKVGFANSYSERFSLPKDAHIETAHGMMDAVERFVRHALYLQYLVSQPDPERIDSLQGEAKIIMPAVQEKLSEIDALELVGAGLTQSTQTLGDLVMQLVRQIRSESQVGDVLIR